MKWLVRQVKISLNGVALRTIVTLPHPNVKVFNYKFELVQIANTVDLSYLLTINILRTTKTYDFPIPSYLKHCFVHLICREICTRLILLRNLLLLLPPNAVKFHYVHLCTTETFVERSKSSNFTMGNPHVIDREVLSRHEDNIPTLNVQNRLSKRVSACDILW